jgi:putative tricarboxylic transport membrane protein
MEVFHYLSQGFAVALEPMNLFYGFIGVLVGTLIGVLPGIGPPGALGILLPASYYLPPVASMIMLSGIYYGAMYGGSTASILVNIPGEAASVVTCLDGYQMARQGRAGPALGIAAFGSFIAGTLGICGLIVFAPPLASFALRFGPPEYFALMVSGLVVLSYLTYGAVVKSLMMATIGLILGVVGNDTITGAARYTFNATVLSDGIGFIPVVMGLFGVAEVLTSIEEEARDIFRTSVRGLLPSKQDWRASIGAIARGSGMGFLLGVLPGGGAVLASFVSYAIEKRVSRHPENFGKGEIAGVAGPESANNAASSGAFIPLLSLGIPSNAATAILLGALLIHGIQPGPLLMRNEPSLFWGVIASMYIGNVMLLILNLPLIGLWIKLLKIPYRLLFPVILLFCLLGVYSVNSSAAEVVIMVVFGLLGYVFRKCRFEATPLVLALVLGPMLEVNFRQSLILSHGDFSVFFRHPISATLLLMAAALLLYPVVMDYMKNKRRIANA